MKISIGDVLLVAVDGHDTLVRVYDTAHDEEGTAYLTCAQGGRTVTLFDPEILGRWPGATFAEAAAALEAQGRG